MWMYYRENLHSTAVTLEQERQMKQQQEKPKQPKKNDFEKMPAVPQSTKK